jgi:hypothetical protein
VKRYIDVFGRDRVHIVIFEDFRSDPAASYRETLAFLGVDPDFSPSFKVVNASAARRSWRLHQALLSPRVISFARSVLPLRTRRPVARLWDALNSRNEPREALDPTVRARLRLELQPDVERLSEQLRRDLSETWR